MSQEFTKSVCSSRPPCVSRAPVRNAHEVQTSIRVSRWVSRESIRPGRLLKQLATGYRISVVFTVGGPLVYQQQSDQFA
jgi:hypothetical protein